MRQAIRKQPSPAQKRRARDTLREYAIPAFASLGLLLVSVEILRGDTIAIYGLVLVIAALLSTASWNAWLLLIEA